MKPLIYALLRLASAFSNATDDAVAVVACDALSAQLDVQWHETPVDSAGRLCVLDGGGPGTYVAYHLWP